MSSPADLLQAGLVALSAKNFSEAINLLVNCCQACEPDAPEYMQAQMALVKAYRGDGQIPAAIALAEELAKHPDLQTQDWARQVLKILAAATPPTTKPSRAKRLLAGSAKLTLSAAAGSLALASGVTIALLVGMVLVLVLALLLIVNSDQPGLGLAIAVAVTLVFNLAVFFISPWVMDLIQGWLYSTRWVELSELARLSPESAQIIQKVCAERKLKQPRLGIIADQNPTAFTYGSLPNSARIVVSQGLFTYLEDEEAATVYAHELGHIVHWDFAVMTVAATLVQITFLLYISMREAGKHFDDNSKAGSTLASVATTAYIFYWVGTYLVLYLSRTREYFADHFAAETTGNPNALSRALVKIAYGILEQGEQSKEQSKLIEGTRTLGIYDPKAAYTTGTAYRLASKSEKVGRVFLWDMFNPWAGWIELGSTHPLTGKRVRALSTYAEQLGLEIEFDMARVMAEGKHLDKNRLYGNFFLDLLLYLGEFLGLATGLLIALAIFLILKVQTWQLFATCGLMGLGFGILAKAMVIYPALSRAPATDVLTMMSDPYASPLRGQPVRLQGELIGRGEAGYAFGSDLQLQDASGLMFLRYVSRFGSLGNFLFGMTQVKKLIGERVTVVGWFRRSIAPWVDLVNLRGTSSEVGSYPRFWTLVSGLGAIAIGLFILSIH
ncbi:MAG: M48 family metalloprotease [Aphanocapsa sp. GSE-SYN-MK-11-07L]|jgi:Zn-dependent protease with chaperone function|nr:M48 family metalloprotease [Aphanocapsa sp. GSE-SYN-MK-11-07L]